MGKKNQFIKTIGLSMSVVFSNAIAAIAEEIPSFSSILQSKSA
ncbi:MAG: hypothetical protein ACFCAD_20345 [Pleurocapsa sp.]